MNLSGFDLNLLKVLNALLQTGTTTGAAKEVGLSQPAVSAALKRLRHALEDPLFVRQGRLLAPTEFAQNLRIPLREVLDRTEGILSGSNTFSPETTEAVFRLLGSDFYSELLMPQLAYLLAKEAPGIKVQLVDSRLDQDIEALENRGLDMALVPATMFPKWVETRDLLLSQFLVIARQGHPDLSQRGITPGEVIPLDLYCGLNHVLFSAAGKLQGQGDLALAALGRRRNVVMTLPGFSGVCNVVSQSDLLALVPEQFARRVAPKLDLAIYQPPFCVEPVQSVLAWHTRLSTAPAHRWLRDRIAVLLKTS